MYWPFTQLFLTNSHTFSNASFSIRHVFGVRNFVGRKKVIHSRLADVQRRQEVLHAHLQTVWCGFRLMLMGVHKVQVGECFARHGDPCAHASRTLALGEPCIVCVLLRIVQAPKVSVNVVQLVRAELGAAATMTPRRALAVRAARTTNFAGDANVGLAGFAKLFAYVALP